LVEIVEILGRSEQGRTRPCVKGRGALRRSQLCEWTVGHLARALRLPIADFAIVEVPAALLKLNMPHLDLGDLGVGPAFGSVCVPSASEFSIGDLGNVSDAEGRDILMFDWWVRNDDRTLTAKGGNPNLLWDTPNRKVVVIDHNLAFNPEFDRRSFLELHVFATQRDAIWTDLDEMARRQKRLLDALPVFDQACDNAPEQWSFADDDCGVPADFDRALARDVLEQCARWDFWKIEP
jgi:hypothetical protein